MATTTINYGLIKPELEDSPPDISVTNANWDILDEELKSHMNEIDTASNLISNLSEEVDQKGDALQVNTIVYVATTGNDTTGDGTEGNPFATITKALSVIPKNLNGHNATVSIGAGSYNEDVFSNYFTGGLLYFSLLGNVTINSFEANYCPSIGIGGAYTLTSGHITAMLSSISASSLTNITISNSIRFGGAPGVGLGGDRATVYFSGTVTFTGNQTNAVFVLNNAQIYVGTVTGTVTTGFRSLSGGKITFLANSLSASTNYVTSTGGRIYSGAQTNTPNY